MITARCLWPLVYNGALILAYSGQAELEIPQTGMCISPTKLQVSFSLK